MPVSKLDQLRPATDKGFPEPEISILIPVFNEEENLVALDRKVAEALESLGRSFEVIYVDDGSTDRSFSELERIARRDSRIRVIGFRRNYGQTAAMAAGITAARGRVLVPMDADLQNDPEDISRLLEKLE